MIGYNLPAQIAPADLNFGPGVTVRTIVSHTATEVIADVDVAADATLGKRDLVLKSSVIPGALAIYDRVDYVKVTPESALATFGDATHPRAISSSKPSDISAAPMENCTPPTMWNSVPWK